MCSQALLVFREVAVRHALYAVVVGGVVVHVALFALVAVSVAEGGNHAEMVFEKAVAVDESGGNVGQGRACGGVEVLHPEVSLVGRVGRSETFVRALADDVVVCERLEIVLHEVRIVARLQVCREQPLGRCVLHHHVHRTSDAVAFHVGGERLCHFQPVEQFCGEDVERYKAVLAVGAWNLQAVHKRIVVAFVHSAEDGILPLARAVAFHRHSAHALNDVCDGNVRREFDGLGTHHVDNLQRVALHESCPHFRAAGVVGHNHGIAQLDGVGLHADVDDVVGGFDGHFGSLVA